MVSYDSQVVVAPQRPVSLLDVWASMPSVSFVSDSELLNPLDLRNPHVRRKVSLDLVEYAEDYADSWLKSKAFKLLGCGSPVVYSCRSCKHKLISPQSCDVRICPKCNTRRFMKLAKGYSSLGSKMKSPRFMTLTVKNPLFLTREDFTKLRNAFNKLKRWKYYKKRMCGGVYGLETTFTKNSWNLHMHILYDGTYIDQKQLSRDWETLTGACVVDIRAVKIRERKNCVLEIIGYSTKVVRLPNVNTYAEYLHAVDRIKLFQSFGAYHNFGSVEKGVKTCPVCGGVEWDIILDPPTCILHEIDPDNPLWKSNEIEERHPEGLELIAPGNYYR